MPRLQLRAAEDGPGTGPQAPSSTRLQPRQEAELETPKWAPWLREQKTASFMEYGLVKYGGENKFFTKELKFCPVKTKCPHLHKKPLAQNVTAFCFRSNGNMIPLKLLLGGM